MKLLRWDGWFLHCNTCSLRKHKPSVTCSVLLPNNYVIVKACGRNIKGSINLAYSENVNLEVPIRFFFQSLPSFFGKEKSTKCTYFAIGRCFIHLPSIFATQSLSLQHIKAWVRYFFSNFYFSPNDSPSKTMKNAFYFI